MPLIRPTLPEITARLRADVKSGLGLGPLLERSMLGVLTKAFAAACHLLYGAIVWVSAQMFPDTAEVQYLERWGGLVGITRKAATFARGAVTVTGLDGTVLPAFRLKVRRTDGAEFLVETTGTITAGVATLGVVAVVAGEDGNTPAGTALVFVQSVAGVQGSAIVTAAGITGGLDQETDDDLRDRVLQRWREPPSGGSVADYKRWALDVAGVTRAWVNPGANGPGTVGVTFTTDQAGTGPIPTVAKLAEVQAYIDERRPVTAQVVVYAPTSYSVPVTLRVTPDTPAVRQAVADALADLFRREAEPGVVLPLSHVREAVSTAAGEFDSLISSPTVDISPGPGALPVLGLVAFL